MDGAKKEMRDARLREILNGKRGVGLEMIEAIADLTGRSLDDLCGRPIAVRPGSLATHPRWTAARLDAERMLAHVRPDMLTASLERVGSFALPEQPVALTGLFVARLAEAVIANPQEFGPLVKK